MDKIELLERYSELYQLHVERRNRLVDICANYLENLPQEKELNKRYFTKMGKELENQNIDIYYTNEPDKINIWFRYTIDNDKAFSKENKIFEFTEECRKYNLSVDFPSLHISLTLYKSHEPPAIAEVTYKIKNYRFDEEKYCSKIDIEQMLKDYDALIANIDTFKTKYPYFLRNSASLGFNRV